MTFVGRLRELIDLSSPPVGTVETMDDLVNLVIERIAETNPEPDTWITGFGYDDSLIAENRHPTRDDLDRASTEVPIVLSHVSGHLLAANSAALAAVGIDADSEDPPGGVIRRRPGTREPNGVMEETAMRPFRQGGEQDPLALEALFRYSASLHASYGITTVQDGGAGLGDIEILKAAAAKEPFPVDVVAFASASRLDDATLDSVEVSQAVRGRFSSRRHQVRFGRISAGPNGLPLATLHRRSSRRRRRLSSVPQLPCRRVQRTGCASDSCG